MLELNKIYNMDCLEGLKLIDDNIIDCVVTSPPYWKLRDYGEETIKIWDDNKNCQHEWDNDFCKHCGAWYGQLGNEPDFNLYIKHLCDIFDEIKRVLKPSGTLWVNIGDIYWGGGHGGHTLYQTSNGLVKDKKYGAGRNYVLTCKWSNKYPRKSLCLIPFRFAIEMVNRSWILRNVIVWHKPNAMPESVKDRFTVDFEYVFFFTKNSKYHFEQQFEPHLSKPAKKIVGRKNSPVQQSQGDPKGEHAYYPQGRNKRCVWSINTKPFKEAHFAVYPPELIEPIIKAGCPQNGIVLDPFIGSGTTAIVALSLGRNFIGFEINKKYCEIAEQRIRNLIDKKE